MTEGEAAEETRRLAGKWFAPTVGRTSFDNDAGSFIEGADAFRAIADTLLSREVDESSYVLLLGWSCALDFELRPGDATSTVRAIFTSLAGRKTNVRVMLWRNTFPGFDNAPAVTFFQGLASADAILDSRTAVAGSHHQKMLIVCTKSRTIGFIGGMDLFPDRIVPGGNGPLHDVHCRLEGPACDELVATFTERWNDHPSHAQKIAGDLQMPKRATLSGGAYGVQVGRTYPSITYVQNTAGQWGYNQLIAMLRQHAPSAAAKVPPIGSMDDLAGRFKPYAFSRGEQSVWKMISRGIATAERFVYGEDQYFVSRDIGRALAARLRQHQRDKKFRIIILICHTSLVDLQQSWQRRKELIDDLIAADPGRSMWSVCHRTPVGGAKSYVHSKTWIFDDELAITGSANSSRRSYTEDSECDVGIVGQPSGFVVRAGKPQPLPSFASTLRCALWAKHLGKTPADWRDAMATASAWFSPPRGSSIGRYDEKGGKDGPSPEQMSATDPFYDTIHDLFWEYLLDPDGT